MPNIYAHGTSDVAITFYDWYLDPTAILVILAAIFYNRGLNCYRGQSSFSALRWKQYFFWAGVIVAILVLASPLDYYSDNSFTLHMVQHLSLMMISTPMILLGAPYLVIMKGLPHPLKKRIVIPIVRFFLFKSLFRFLSHPLISLAVYMGMTWLWHYPPLYDLALRNEYWHLLEHFLFFYASVFFWWNIIDPYPIKSRLHHIQRIGLIFAAAIQNSLISALITFQSELVYDFSMRVNPFGLEQHTDQILGGLTMWVPGSMMYILAMGICFATMVAQEKRPPPSQNQRKGDM